MRGHGRAKRRRRDCLKEMHAYGRRRHRDPELVRVAGRIRCRHKRRRRLLGIGFIALEVGDGDGVAAEEDLDGEGEGAALRGGVDAARIIQRVLVGHADAAAWPEPLRACLFRPQAAYLRHNTVMGGIKMHLLASDDVRADTT
jgi:hypothetical protein